MAKLLYCWRCAMEIPMLDEAEWERVAPFLANAVSDLKQYRETHGVSLAEAMAQGYGKEVLAEYFRITGFQETNPNALWHHRLSLFGPPCVACGKPLRTPNASFCAECGTLR